MATHHELGVAAFNEGRLDAAEAHFRDALAEAPDLAFSDLAAVHLLQGRDDLALPLLLRALAHAPASARARHNLALLFLARQTYELGWLLHEARRGVPEMNILSPEVAFPEWRGEPLAGRHIVVFGEQGMGDQLMFARYLRELRDRGAEVTYLCSAPLASVLPGATAAIRRNFEADFWSLVSSLPLRLGAAARPIPAPAEIPIPWRGGGGVGVLAGGSPTYLNDRHRSLHGADADRLRALGRDLSIAATGARDFRETAEIVAGLDLVITVDTALAHLAGSMGVPTWILLPAIGTDWRWRAAPETSPWYPSVRLFRQPASARWPEALDRVESALSAG